MNPFSYQSLTSLLLNVILVGYILSKNPRAPSAQVYVLLLASFILWSIPEFIVRAFPGNDMQRLLLLIRIEWTGISFIPALMAHFVLAYPRRSPFLDYPWSLLVLYTPSVVLTTFLWAGNLLVEDVVVGPLGYHSAKVGSAYLPLAFLYTLIILLALAYLSRAYRRAEDHRSRMMLGLVAAGFAIPTLAGTVTEVFGPYIFQSGTRLGFGTAYITVFLAFVALAVFRYGFLVIRPVREVGTVGRRFGWERGQNHLVLERRRDNSFSAFRELVQDAPGLCVTAFPPRMLSERYALHKTPFLWLSSQKNHRWSLKPTYLEVDVLHTILKFLGNNRGSTLLIDDLEYLAEVNGFKPLVRTVSTVAAAASKYGCTLISNLNPASLEPFQVASLRGLFDRIQTLDGEEQAAEPSFTSPSSILWREKREKCFQEISRSGLRGKFVVSTLFPEKLRAEFGLQDASFVWISAAGRSEYPTYDATRLHYEVLRDASKAVHEDTLIYLGELDVLAEEAGFLTVLEYVKRLTDLAISKSSLAVATVHRASMSAGQLSILEKRFSVVV